MLDNLINGKPEQAQTLFHTYLKNKIHDVFHDKQDNDQEITSNNT